MLQYRFGVKHLNWCVDYKTSPDFPSAWEWIDNDHSFYFWVNLSFKGWACNNVYIFVTLKKYKEKTGNRNEFVCLSMRQPVWHLAQR